MSIADKVFDKLLPHKCDICGGLAVPSDEISFDIPGDTHICSNCFTSIVPNPPDRRWFLCLSEPYEGDPCPGLVLYMPFVYNEFFGKTIPTIKFRGKTGIAVLMGRILGSLMKSEGINADMIIPVPLSEKRILERGFNQAERIGYGMSNILNLPVIENGLVRIRNTQRQTGLKDNTMRSANIIGAFDIGESNDFRGKTVLLVDDVATTGNTLHEAACKLLESGATKVLCVALCGNRGIKNEELF